MQSRQWCIASTAVLCAVCAAGATDAVASAESRSRVSATIKSEISQIIAGINAHDIDQATRFDAEDIVSMQSGRPASTGIEEERKGLSQAFQYAPTWRLHLVDETVDVAESGEMAVYRSTYNEESIDGGVPMTHRVNFIAEFRQRRGGQYQVIWSIVSSIEKSHKK